MTSDPPHHPRQPAPSSEPTSSDASPSAESSALQRMRLERDAALEDLAFVREQLRSTEAYYDHQFELVHARIDAEHRSLLDELSRLGSERPRRSRPGPARNEARPVPSEPDDARPLPRTR